MLKGLVGRCMGFKIKIDASSHREISNIRNETILIHVLYL